MWGNVAYNMRMDGRHINATNLSRDVNIMNLDVGDMKFISLFIDFSFYKRLKFYVILKLICKIN